MNTRTLAKITGYSYFIIFFAAIFANFFVLDAIIANPLQTVTENGQMVRFGILAFLITAVFDIVVAWTLYEMYKNHIASTLSTFFRVAHAIMMGIAVFALSFVFTATTNESVLHYVDTFNMIWLIGLFFFGFHLLLLPKIISAIPKWIKIFLVAAGIMYIIDTSAHILLPNYATYADIFLTLVAIPSILGEMAFAVWMFIKGGRQD